MSYKLTKPYTELEKNNFIVENNHNKGLRIEETDSSLFALKDDEIVENNKIIKNTTPKYLEKVNTLRIEALKREYLKKKDDITNARSNDKDMYECGIISQDVFNSRETKNKALLIAGWNEFWQLSGLTPPIITE